MKSSTWPTWLDDIWAKSPPLARERGEPLAEHTWRVLTRLRDYARERPWLPALTGVPNLWAILFWSSFFHDWGKAAAGFQEMLRGGAQWSHRHEVLSLAFLPWLSGTLSDQDMVLVGAAILYHHRDPEELRSFYPSGPAGEDALNDLLAGLNVETIEKLYKWAGILGEWVPELHFEELGLVPPTLPDEATAVKVVLTRSLPFIRKMLVQCGRYVEALSEEHNHAVTVASIFLRGELVKADHQASAHVENSPKIDVTQDNILQRVQIASESLYDHQLQAARAKESVILVAPTGSGKTEAALLWFANQANRRPYPSTRFFYVLPYQASMNAMYDRLNTLLPGHTGLIHGRSLVALYNRLSEDDSAPANAIMRARWMDQLARLDYHPVRVFSLYEMLKNAYQTRGFEARLTDYASASFVLDEIHAYEPSRLAFLMEMAAYLKRNFDARFFVMSATLPPAVRDRISHALEQPEYIVSSLETFRLFARHKVHLLPGELLSAAGVDRVVSCFREGRSVLVVCNTVANAQAFYLELLNRLPDRREELTLIHGGFNSRDRQQREKRIMQIAGVKSRDRQPAIVVATQVVEVSLNIDLDVLFTEPAPLEALVQRFGRVNRSRMVPEAPVHVYTDPRDGQGVYDPALIDRAIDVLSSKANGRLVDEAAIQSWLDEIYTDAVLDKWAKEYANATTDFRTAFLNHLHGFESDPASEERFERLFDSIEVLPSPLQAEYEQKKESNIIEATELLVSISYRRFYQLLRNGRAHRSERNGPVIVDASYTDLGLMFEGLQ